MQVLISTVSFSGIPEVGDVAARRQHCSLDTGWKVWEHWRTGLVIPCLVISFLSSAARVSTCSFKFLNSSLMTWRNRNRRIAIADFVWALYVRNRAPAQETEAQEGRIPSLHHWHLRPTYLRDCNTAINLSSTYRHCLERGRCHTLVWSDSLSDPDDGRVIFSRTSGCIRSVRQYNLRDFVSVRIIEVLLKICSGKYVQFWHQSVASIHTYY